jgi:NADPH2:quinone reductase
MTSATETTIAARLHEHGAPLAIEEVPSGTPAEGEVRVSLDYGGVNPIDRYVAAGRVAPDGPLPRTLGGEAAGWLDGRPVLVAGEGLGAARDGVWSGTAIVPVGTVVELPHGVGTREAAAMGVAGLTAWNCVHDVARIRAEDRVLVLGASGGVGSMIVSLVSAEGATVWGQTGAPDKAAQISAYGAGRVIVADAESLGAQLGELAPTVVFDPLGDGFLSPVVEALAPGGRIVSFGTSAGAEVSFNLQTLYRKAGSLLSYGGMRVGPQARRSGLEAALEALAEGTLHVEIDEVLALEQVGEAFTRLEQRRVSGKLLLDLRG